jgi:hypothetical protein
MKKRHIIQQHFVFQWKPGFKLLWLKVLSNHDPHLLQFVTEICICSSKITHSMGQSSPKETERQFGYYKAPGISWKPKAYFYVHKSQPWDPPHTHRVYSFINTIFKVDRLSPSVFQQLFHFLRVAPRSRDSTVGISTGYRLDERRVGVPDPVGSKIFSSPRDPNRFRGPTSRLSNGYWGQFPWGWGVKRPGREADHSSPTSAQVKKCSYGSTHPFLQSVFMS